MKRTTTIIIGILLGACAAAVGIGSFLRKANADRRILVGQLGEADMETRQARSAQQRIIEETNAKLEAANREMVKAQALIKALQDDQELFGNAVMVGPAKNIPGWISAVGLGLGVSFQVPSAHHIAVNDGTMLVVESNRATLSRAEPSRWMTVERYSQAREQELQSSLSSSTQVIYNLRGHVLVAQHGTDAITHVPVMVGRIRYRGENTYLIRIQGEIVRAASRSALLMSVLASFRFAP